MVCRVRACDQTVSAESRFSCLSGVAAGILAIERGDGGQVE